MIQIEYLETEIPVYDITVQDNHNFFANQILVHNCTEIGLITKPISHIDEMTPGEIALCILTSINVGVIRDLAELEHLADLAVRALDELIDYQDYPVAAALSTKKRRSLGVGFTGLAHYLAKHKVKYEDPEAAQLVHQLAEALQFNLIKASVQLAKEKGPCEFWEKTKYGQGLLPIDHYKSDIDEMINAPALQYDWEALRIDLKKFGIRNSTLSAQAPVESSSLITNSTNGIEPPRSLLSIKKSKKGPIKQIVPQFATLKNHYTLLWDMSSNEGYFKIVGAMQKFFDQSISTNWNYNPLNYQNNEIPIEAMINDLLLTYKLGHKTAYYSQTYDMKKDDSVDEHADVIKTITSVMGAANIYTTEEPEITFSSNSNDEYFDDDDCEACKL